jgi:hypothetical protein
VQRSGAQSGEERPETRIAPLIGVNDGRRTLLIAETGGSLGEKRRTGDA